LVQIDLRSLDAEIDDVGVPRPVNVGQSNPSLIEAILEVEPRRTIHCDLGPEPAIANVWPVADFAVADTDDVDEAVAAHIG
jgi:hypothetical protein